MWPSYRLFWPPSRSLRADRGAGKKGFPLESMGARICKEAGARVVPNMLVRNMDLAVPQAGDARRLKVVADGLPLWGGVQLAVDTTLVSALRGDGNPRRGAATRDGAALSEARRDKERTYPELGAAFGGSGTGGWWSMVRRRMEQAWRLRWTGLLACAAPRCFAQGDMRLSVTTALLV